MRCPFCRDEETRVVDSREADDGQAIRRRRQCLHCERRFTTVEVAALAVVKRSGAQEPFSRAKVIAGVRKACQGRPVDSDSIEILAHRVEETVRAAGRAEVPSQEVGRAILGPTGQDGPRRADGDERMRQRSHGAMPFETPAASPLGDEVAVLVPRQRSMP